MERRKRGRKREWSISRIKEDRGGRRERRRKRREISKCTQIKTCLITCTVNMVSIISTYFPIESGRYTR